MSYYTAKSFLKPLVNISFVTTVYVSKSFYCVEVRTFEKTTFPKLYLLSFPSITGVILVCGLAMLASAVG